GHAQTVHVSERHVLDGRDATDAPAPTWAALGKVHIEKDDLPSRHGAWPGTAVGALAGLLLPPAVLVSEADGAGDGPLAGHFRQGLADADLRELCDVLGVGGAGLVVVARSEGGGPLPRPPTDASPAGAETPPPGPR